MKSMRIKFSLKTLLPILIGASIGLGQTPRAQAASEAFAPGEPRPSWSFREAGLIPVQSAGRVKPLDSFAREVVLFTTGSRYYQGWNPVDMVLSWMTAPQVWDAKPFIEVQREDVKRQLGLDEKRMRFSPKELISDSHMVQYADELMHRPPVAPGGGMKEDPREAEIKRVLERVGLFRRVISGEAWPAIPVATPATWKSLADGEKDGDPIRSAYANMIISYRAGEQTKFETSANQTRTLVEGAVANPAASFKNDILVEYEYSTLHPFLISWILYLTAALIWLAVIMFKPEGKSLLKTSALVVTGIALAIHIAGFGMRCYVAGRPPVTNMYESIIWVSFGVMAFACILYRVTRQPVLLAVACTLATFGLIAGDSAPAMMDPGIHPLVPVLRSNYWLTIHVLTITLGYAAFALTAGLGNVTLFQFLRPSKGSVGRINNLNQLTYRAMQFGTVLLAAGTILGGIWADYSWGRFWGWDPKEVWALIALLCYLAVLHSRFTGWVGQFAFALWTVVSFMSVVMAWYGVNFVLGVGLHSYGFSSGGRGWVAGFVGAQLLYVAVVALVKTRRSRLTGSGTQAPAPA